MGRVGGPGGGGGGEGASGARSPSSRTPVAGGGQPHGQPHGPGRAAQGWQGRGGAPARGAKKQRPWLGRMINFFSLPKFTFSLHQFRV